jgi:hypothetical protein
MSTSRMQDRLEDQTATLIAAIYWFWLWLEPRVLHVAWLSGERSTDYRRSRYKAHRTRSAGRRCSLHIRRTPPKNTYGTGTPYSDRGRFRRTCGFRCVEVARLLSFLIAGSRISSFRAAGYPLYFGPLAALSTPHWCWCLPKCLKLN